jgi:hypothetical protein
MKQTIVALLMLLSLYSSAQKTKEPNLDSLRKLMSMINTSKEQVPPDFDGSKTILIIYKDTRNAVNKYLEKDIDKEYTGQYRLLEPDDKISPKDTAMARYFMRIQPNFTAGSFTDHGRETPDMEYQIVLTDRRTMTMYYSRSASCFTCLFKEYFKKLEEKSKH